MVLFWGALILVIVAMVRYVGRDHSAGYPQEPPATPPQPSGAEEILAERFARGEIGADEYRERLDVLRHGTEQEEKS
jgi:putative membrane protein